MQLPKDFELIAMMTREVQDLRRSDHYPLPHLRLQLHWGSLAAS